MSTARRLLAAALAAATVGATVPTAAAVFGGAGAGWLAVAVALPAAIGLASVLAGARRAPAHVAAAGRPAARLGAELAAGVILLALLPSGPGGGALTGLADGAAQLATTLPPATAGGPPLGLAVAVLVVASGLAVEASLPGAGLAALAPAGAVYLAALVVGGGGPRPPGWDAAAVVAVAGLYLLARRPGWSGRRATPAASPVGGSAAAGGRAALGRIGVGAAVLAVVVAVAVPLGGVLPGAGDRTPYDLQAAVSPPSQPLGQVSLLSTYAAVHDGPVRPVFSVVAPGIDAASLYWRVDAFDRYQPAGWISTAALHRAGTQLPAGPAPAVPVTTVAATVHLRAPAEYLPAPPGTVSVSVPGLAVSDPDAVIAVPAGTAPPTTYRLAARVPAPSRTDLLASAAAGSPGPGPVLPGPITTLATRLIERAGPDAFSRLAAIASYLTGSGFSLHPVGRSPIGSGSYQVLQLLDVTHDGSAEQYASAFALLARAMGFSTRLAVGYTGGQRRPGSSEVVFTTRDLTVWPEVDLAGIGWLPFPVAPALGGPGRARTLPPASALGQALRQQQRLNAAAHQAPSPAPGPGRGAPAPAPAHAGGVPAAVLAAVAPALVVLGLLVLAGAKLARRRRQRRGPEPARRVSGAWEHVLDRLAELGVGLPASLTSAEVVERAGGRFGEACARPVAALSALVDAARYDRRSPMRPEVADVAWRSAGEVDDALRLAVGARRRARARLSPAPWRR